MNPLLLALGLSFLGTPLLTTALFTAVICWAFAAAQHRDERNIDAS